MQLEMKRFLRGCAHVKCRLGACTISFRCTQTNEDGRERLPFLHANGTTASNYVAARCINNCSINVNTQLITSTAVNQLILNAPA